MTKIDRDKKDKIVEMKDEKEMSFTQIAEKLNIHPKTAERNYHSHKDTSETNLPVKAKAVEVEVLPAQTELSKNMDYIENNIQNIVKQLTEAVEHPLLGDSVIEILQDEGIIVGEDMMRDFEEVTISSYKYKLKFNGLTDEQIIVRNNFLNRLIDEMKKAGIDHNNGIKWIIEKLFQYDNVEQSIFKLSKGLESMRGMKRELEEEIQERKILLMALRQLRG